MQGATSGIGAAIAESLAARGAQIILLTQTPLNDLFLVEYIEDMREKTGNELITAEQVDLLSLHSIRQFATKWVDNAPPRRLDMIILCANIMTPKGNKIQLSEDGVESTYALNYLANFHLLSILSPALRAQPADRDVRVIFGTCNSYIGAQMPEQVPVPKLPKPKAGKPGILASKPPPPLIAKDPSAAYGSSKVALMAFALAFQKHLANYKRPDKAPSYARVFMVDPGWTRTPGMRRYLTAGSLWGLAMYLIMWPFWWLTLKSAQQGAQTFLYAAMEATFAQNEGDKLLKECRELGGFFKSEITDEAAQQKLWQTSEKAVEALEKEGATKRAELKQQDINAKKEKDLQEKKAQEAERKPGSRKSRKADQ